MSESLDQEPNKVVLTISGVRDNPAQPWVQRIIISIQNSLDDTDNFNNNNSEDIPNYDEAEDLKQKQKSIIQYIKEGYERGDIHFSGIDKLRLEGEE
jgi:hypothetical protein